MKAVYRLSKKGHKHIQIVIPFEGLGYKYILIDDRSKKVKNDVTVQNYYSAISAVGYIGFRIALVAIV